MKAKLKTLEIISISMVIILNAYLVHLNINLGSYQKTKANISTANYVQAEDIKEEIDENEPSSEELINEIEEIPQIKEVIDETIKEIKEKEEAEKNPIVYDGKTLKELSETIEKSLNSTISGKGYLIASYCIEKGVDPYMATAIILHETGCKWGCSRLVRECNNVGGQKGKGCGSYSYFPSLDEGIKAFVDNLYRNYISYGLTTPETINPKYASDKNWAVNVNKYIESIKAQ